MREIKFPLEGKQQIGEWVYGSLVHSRISSLLFILKSGKALLKLSILCTSNLKQSASSPELYAGVFNSLCGDKECDEIYEGDKIAVTYANQGMSNSHEHTITGVVKFKNGSFVVEWDFPKKGKYKYQTLNSVKTLGDCGVVIKIIGNIPRQPRVAGGGRMRQLGEQWIKEVDT